MLAHPNATFLHFFFKILNLSHPKKKTGSQNHINQEPMLHRVTLQRCGLIQSSLSPLGTYAQTPTNTHTPTHLHTHYALALHRQISEPLLYGG